MLIIFLKYHSKQGEFDIICKAVGSDRSAIWCIKHRSNPVLYLNFSMIWRIEGKRVVCVKLKNIQFFWEIWKSYTRNNRRFGKYRKYSIRWHHFHQDVCIWKQAGIVEILQKCKIKLSDSFANINKSIYFTAEVVNVLIATIGHIYQKLVRFSIFGTINQRYRWRVILHAVCITSLKWLGISSLIYIIRVCA